MKRPPTFTGTIWPQSRQWVLSCQGIWLIRYVARLREPVRAMMRVPCVPCQTCLTCLTPLRLKPFDENARLGPVRAMMRNQRCDRIWDLALIRCSCSLLVLVQGLNHKSRLAIRTRLSSRLFYSGGFGRQMEKEGTGKPFGISNGKLQISK